MKTTVITCLAILYVTCCVAPMAIRAEYCRVLRNDEPPELRRCYQASTLPASDAAREYADKMSKEK